MTLNGVMALIFRYLTEFVYDNRCKTIRPTSVSKSTFNTRVTIVIRSAQLFIDYLGKTKSDNSV